jgi:hypothetical protein
MPLLEMPLLEAVIYAGQGLVAVLFGFIAAVLLIRSRRSPDIVLWRGVRTPAPRLLAPMYLCVALTVASLAVSGSVFDPGSAGQRLILGVGGVFFVAAVVTGVMWWRRRGQEPQAPGRPQ